MSFLSTSGALAAGPNVLLIILDDLNDYVGALGGHPQAWTPNIDTLAGQGTIFTNAHSTAAQCHPARVSLLTGISPARSGVRSNQDKPWRDFLPQAVSLQQAFQQAGYFTAGYGKIFHTADHSNWDQLDRKGASAPKPPADQIPLNGLTELASFGHVHDWGPLDLKVSRWRDHGLASRAINYIRNRDPNDPQPFFLAYGSEAPHAPWYVPPRYYDMIAGGDTNSIVLPTVLTNDLDDVGQVARDMAKVSHWLPITGDPSQHRMGLHSYLAEAALIDEQVGRLLNALDSSPYGANTIVVLVSDHGLHFGEKQSWGKRKLWEEDTRVPLMIRMPQTLAINVPKEIHRPVSISAVFPTLLELAGIPLPNYTSNDPKHRIDYRSLVPLLNNRGQGQWAGPAVTFGTNRSQNISLRMDQFRFTLYSNGFVELYDHALDPSEWTNIADLPENQTFVAQWKQDAQTYLSGTHRAFGFVDGDARIGDSVWHDVNRDGIKDSGEPGLPQITVKLLNCAGDVLATTNTTANGKYSFRHLAKGKYQLSFVAPGGFALSPRFMGTERGKDSDPFPHTGMTSCFFMAEGQTRLGIDAGMSEEPLISGM